MRYYKQYSQEGDFGPFLREGDQLPEPADFEDPDSASAQGFVAKYVHPYYYELFQRVWLEGNASAHVNLFANSSSAARRSTRGPVAVGRGRARGGRGKVQSSVDSDKPSLS